MLKFLVSRFDCIAYAHKRERTTTDEVRIVARCRMENVNNPFHVTLDQAGWCPNMVMSTTCPPANWTELVSVCYKIPIKFHNNVCVVSGCRNSSIDQVSALERCEIFLIISYTNTSYQE